MINSTSCCKGPEGKYFRSVLSLPNPPPLYFQLLRKKRRRCQDPLEKNITKIQPFFNRKTQIFRYRLKLLKDTSFIEEVFKVTSIREIKLVV